MYQIIINTLTGAGTGYVTNNIAIKMLFKKYFGRFGGIIEDTHDEFVENMAQLIEKDLINHNTLKEEFGSEKFHNYIKELVKDLFLHSLPKNSIGLKEIQGVHRTKENMLAFLDKNQASIEKLANKLLSRPFNQAVSYPQILNVSQRASQILNNNKSTYLNSLIPSLKSFKIEELLSEESLMELTNNISKIIYKIDFSKFDKSVNDSIYNLLKLLNMDEILQCAKEEIQEIPFKQLISDKEAITKNLIEKLLEISTSDDGRIAMEESVHAILDSLKEVNVSLLSLLDDDIKISIKAFIRNELPNVIHKVIEFMDKNEKDLEDLINNSIEKAIDNGIFPDLKKKIVSIFYTNIVADFKILNMVKQYIRRHHETAEEEIVNQVIDILENKSIGELYKKIADRKIITSQKVITLILQNLQKMKTGAKIRLMDVVLEKQVKNYVDVDLDFLKNSLIPSSVEKLKTQYIYTNQLKNKIDKETKKLINGFKVKTLEELFYARIETITQKIVTSIDSDKILNAILSNVELQINKNINEVLNVNAISIDYERYLDGIVAQKSIKEMLTYAQNEEAYVAVESALIKVVVDNLEEILKGNVSDAVKKELAKLPPSKIKEMVEEFMGEELKPINYFGAILGGAAGAGVGLLSIPVWANPFIYAVVGVATNYLAIKMLFQPYSPLTIGKFKIPLSEGVLPSNKAKMASKMSEFVDEFMLNGTSIKDFFAHNGENLKSFIKSHIAKDDYAMLDKIIHQNSNTKEVSNEAVNFLFNFLDKHETMIGEKIFAISMDYYERREEYVSKSSDFAYEAIFKREFKECLYKKFEKSLDREKSLEFLSKDVLLQLDVFIEQTFYSFLDVLSDSKKLRETVLSFESSYEKFVSSKTIAQSIDSSLSKRLSSKVNNSILELFYTKETINELLNFFTKGEFGADSKLSDMINGMLPKIIENNLNLIIKGSVLPAIREHKKVIRSEILQKVPFGLGWALKRDVNRTIDVILDKEVPQFIDEKILQINEIVQEVLDTKLMDLGYTNDAINHEKVNELTQSILSNEKFQRSFASTMDVFMDAALNMKIKDALNVFNVTKLSDVYDMFEPNINAIVTTLLHNLKRADMEILDVIKKLTKDEITTKLLKETTVEDVLKDIDRAVFLREFQYLERNIKASKQFQESLKIILDNFITSFFKEEFLNREIFKEDLDAFLKNVIEEKEQLRGILAPFFKEFILNINEILDLKLKDHMLEIIIDSAFLSVDKKIMDLLHAVDFKKVITKEIQAMHPKELEEMFYSFAGAYFNKLVLYGSLGFIFGLLTLIQA